MMDPADIRRWFIHRINNHFELTGEDPIKFGRRATGNSRFIEQLQAGANPRLDTVQRVLDYIRRAKHE